jgi:hypothetical protein
MHWLYFIFALEAGVLPNTSFLMYQPDLRYIIGAVGFYTELEASIEAWGFYVGGAVRTNMWPQQEGLSFWPFQMTYRFEAGWRNQWFTLGFRHYCMHPVVPYLQLTGAPTQLYEGIYEEIYIRINARAPLDKRGAKGVE